MRKPIRKTGTRCLIIPAILFLLVSGAACDKKPSADSRELRVGIESMPKTLDPRFATDAYGMRITQHLLFNTLVELGYDLQITPSLAERWETPDDTTYLFYLRKNAVFHDGQPLTAEDVKFTFDHLMAPETQSPFAGTYSGTIARIDVVDPHTVRFVLTQPVASFLTSIIMPILPRHLVSKGEGFADTLVGSGPFKFERITPNDIVLTANTAYAEGRPKMDRIVFKVITDENTRFLKAQKEELDLIINAMPDDKIQEFAKAPLNTHYSVIETPGISYNYLAFNMADPALQDLRLRKAIAHGINVDEIIQYKLGGHAVRATGLLSPVNWFCNPQVAQYAHDPAAARQLLDSAGFVDPDGDGPQMRMRLEMKISNNAQVTDIARVMQSQLADIGIQLDLKAFEWGTFYGDIQAGNFQVTSMRWVGVTEPDFYYDIFHSVQVPPSGRNRGRYANPRIDELVQQGRTTLDPETRRKIYAQIQEIAAEELPYISLWYINNVSIVHKRLTGYRQHPMAGFFSFKAIDAE